MTNGRKVLWGVGLLAMSALWGLGGILLLSKYKRESRLVREYQALAARYPLPVEGYKRCLRRLGGNPVPGGPYFVPVYDDYEVVLYYDAQGANGRGEWNLAPEVLRIRPPEVKDGGPIDEKTALALGQYHASTYFHKHPDRAPGLLKNQPTVTHEPQEDCWQVVYGDASAPAAVVIHLKSSGGLIDCLASK